MIYETERTKEMHTSLTNAIEKWLDEQLDAEGLEAYNCDGTAELMASSAINILLTQKGMQKYFFQNYLMIEI